MIKIGVRRLHPDACLPERAYSDDAGFDLYATEQAVLAPGDRAAVGCGFAIALVPGTAGLVLPRSGAALRDGVTVLNAPGLIDAGYRGELKVILINHDRSATYRVEVGDRIAQLLIVELPIVSFEHLDALPESDRGAAGFGSTGQKR